MKVKRSIASLKIAVINASISKSLTSGLSSFSKDPHCGVHISYVEDLVESKSSKAVTMEEDDQSRLTTASQLAEGYVPVAVGEIIPSDMRRVGKLMAPSPSHTPDFQHKPSEAASGFTAINNAFLHLKEQARQALSETTGADAAIRNVLERWRVDESSIKWQFFTPTSPSLSPASTSSPSQSPSSTAAPGQAPPSKSTSTKQFTFPNPLLAFKYPILQPIKTEVVKKGKTKQTALSWRDHGGCLVLDVYHEGKAREKHLARTAISLRSLVSDEASGGAQPVRAIRLPIKCGKDDKRDDNAWIQVCVCVCEAMTSFRHMF